MFNSRFAVVHPAALPQAFSSAETPSPEARFCWLAYMLEDLASGKLSEAEFTALLDQTFPRE